LGILQERRDVTVPASDSEVLQAKTDLVKPFDVLQTEIELPEKENSALKERLDQFMAVVDSKEAELQCSRADHESFIGLDISPSENEMASRIPSNQWERKISARSQQSEILRLTHLVKQCRSFISCRRDSISTKKARCNSTMLTAYSQISAFTPTLKRSQ
jgi:hypothetical protein